MKGLNMIDPKLKKKIINTISQYEEKCNHLQAEVKVLQETIDQLNNSQQPLDPELDKHINALREELSEHPSEEVNSRLVMLTEMLTSLQTKTQEQQQQMNQFIGHATELLKTADTHYTFSKPIYKLEKALSEQANEKLLANKFLNVLEQYLTFCRESFGEQSNDKYDLESTAGKKPKTGFLSQMLNDSIRELLASLCFPEQLTEKTNQLLDILHKPLSERRLIDVLDRVTELVVQAFNLEQNRLKSFLQDVSNQLVDFDSYLQSSRAFGNQVRQESKALACGIDDQIHMMQQDMDQCTELAELTTQIQKGFTRIGERMREFRKNEEQRIVEYEDQIDSLKLRLTQAEQQTADIQEILSYRELQMNVDSLTGLPNRGAYDEHLMNAWHRWQRGFGDLTLAIADIDNFKEVNDTYGHLAGDKVLKKISYLFRTSLRAIDFIARYGGEEFVIVFERTDSTSARKALEEIRKQVEETEFYYRDTKVTITISFGVTMLKQDDDLERFFERADKAMYKAKKAGRNRIELL